MKASYGVSSNKLSFFSVATNAIRVSQWQLISGNVHQARNFACASLQYLPSALICLIY